MDPEQKDPLEQLKDQQTANHSQNRKDIHDLRGVTQVLADRVGQIEDLVDGRFIRFRQELQSEIMPLRSSINFHNLQITKIEQTTAETAKGLARVEGSLDGLKEQETNNHLEKTKKLDVLLERFNIYVGGVESNKENSDDRKRTFREWTKVILATLSFGGIYKLLHHWWTTWHK